MSSRMSQSRWTRFFAPLVWLAVLQVIVLSVMASAPELHERFHSDAHDSGHHCFSTDLQAGTIDLTVVVPIVAPELMERVIAINVVSTETRQSLPLHLCGSLLEHGPPALA